MTTIKWHTFFTTFALLLIPSAAADQNVSFSAVLEQPFNEPSGQLVYGDDENQKVMHWTAADATVDIVFIHGGCWLSAYDIKHTYAMSSALNEAGFSVYSIEYRRTGDTGGGWPTTFNDIQRGFSEVLTHRTSKRPLVVMGHSAGGHLGLLLASREDFKQQIDGIIGLAAITDINAYAQGKNSCESVTADFMGGTPQQRADAYRDANPVNYPAHSNTTLLQGDADRIVAPSYAARLPRAAVKVVPEAGHFDWVHPNTKAFTTLLDTLEQLTND